MSEKLRFIVDENVGKLTKLLRLAGFDAVFFDGADDADMVAIALKENRVLLTRDTQIMKRSVVTGGQVNAILIQGDRAEYQIKQVFSALHLEKQSEPFIRCLECNHILEPRDKAEMKDRVPPYVYKTQQQFMECPNCRRVYWRGTHWKAMTTRLGKIVQAKENSSAAE